MLFTAQTYADRGAGSTQQAIERLAPLARHHGAPWCAAPSCPGDNWGQRTRTQPERFWCITPGRQCRSAAVAVRGMMTGARGGAGHRGCQGSKGVPAGAEGQERGTDRPYTTQGCPKSRWPGVCRCRSHRHTGSPPTAVRGVLQLGNRSVL